MDDTVIALGDVVRMKSGGPLMTVESEEREHARSSRRLTCVWFVANDRPPITTTVVDVALEKVDPRNP